MNLYDLGILICSLGMCWATRWNLKAVIVSLLFLTAFAYTEYMVRFKPHGDYTDFLVMMGVYSAYIPVLMFVLDLKRTSSYILLLSVLTIALYNYFMFVEWAMQSYGVFDLLYTPFMKVMYALILLVVSFNTGLMNRLYRLTLRISKVFKEFKEQRRENGRRFRILG